MCSHWGAGINGFCDECGPPETEDRCTECGAAVEDGFPCVVCGEKSHVPIASKREYIRCASIGCERLVSHPPYCVVCLRYGPPDERAPLMEDEAA